MLNSVFNYTLTESGAQLVGKEKGDYVTPLNIKLMETLDFKIMANGLIHELSDWTGAPDEVACYDGMWHEQDINILRLDELVYLKPKHLEVRTGHCRAVIYAYSHNASFVTGMGWTNELRFDTMVPEDLSLASGIKYLKKLIKGIEFAPKDNTGGWEDAAELPEKSWEKIQNKIGTALSFGLGQNVVSYHDENITFMLSLVPAGRSEVEKMDSNIAILDEVETIDLIVDDHKRLIGLSYISQGTTGIISPRELIDRMFATASQALFQLPVDGKASGIEWGVAKRFACTVFNYAEQGSLDHLTPEEARKQITHMLLRADHDNFEPLFKDWSLTYVK